MIDLKTTISPSPVRRAIATLMLLGLGGLLIYLAFASPPDSLFWQAFLLAAGGLALYGANRLYHATSFKISLTDDNIVDSAGRELCRLDNIASVQRGAFAFKPSNGFLIRLKTPLVRTWAPGLWWRFGRNVGVGGVIPASEAKFMAEMIALHLADLQPEDLKF
jgi:hypothetical protein